MVTINLTVADRNSIQSAVEAIQEAGSDQLEDLMQQLLQGNEGVIRRFAKGAYNHPITWWVGVFQLQMQKGMWGARHQASANIRGSILTQILRPVRSELKQISSGEDSLLLSRTVKYNLKYKKADITGRFVGSQFTNYASTAGHFGNARLPTNAKRMNKKSKKTALAGFREFSAEMVGQLVLYATLLSALGTWLYFGSLYAPLIVGIAGTFLFWVIYGLILGRKNDPE